MNIMKKVEEGTYKGFVYPKEGLSFSTINQVMEKNTLGREEFEDMEIEIKDSDKSVRLSFFIDDRYKTDNLDDVLLDTLKRIREDLIRLRKLKSDLILLGIYEPPIMINWYRY